MDHYSVYVFSAYGIVFLGLGWMALSSQFLDE